MLLRFSAPCMSFQIATHPNLNQLSASRVGHLCNTLMQTASAGCLRQTGKHFLHQACMLSMTQAHAALKHACMLSMSHQACMHAWSNLKQVHAQEADAERWAARTATVQAETETAFLVGVQVRGQQKKMGYSMAESLQELGRLASTAGLQVHSQWHFTCAACLYCACALFAHLLPAR